MRFYPKTIIAVLFLLPSLGRAEVIKLKSGPIIEGKILAQDKVSIRLDTGMGVPVTYFLDEIEEITASTPKVQETPKQKISAPDQLEKQAIALIDQGNGDEGLALMQEAINQDPTPMRRMNYGSILFGHGAADFQNGNKTKGTETLLAAQQQLRHAIDGFDPKREAVFLAQAYFLLGEIELNAFADKIKAKDFYQKAVSYYDNSGARAALDQLE